MYEQMIRLQGRASLWSDDEHLIPCLDVMTTELSTLLALLAAGMLVIAAGVWYWMNRTPTILRDADEALPLFGGLDYTDVVAKSPNVVSAAGPEVAFAAVRGAGTVAAPAERAVMPRDQVAPTATRPVIREFTTTRPRAMDSVGAPVDALVDALVDRRGTALPTPRGAERAIVSPAGVPGTMIEGHALRFSIPAEGTLQFLPGRLVIEAGQDAGREIRFVSVPGPNGTEVTFGRAEGELYRHIELRDKTVSRQHARLVWRAGHWYLHGLSQTNPVAINGSVLDGSDAPCLADGDRIEMGEVLFTFRSR